MTIQHRFTCRDVAVGLMRCMYDDSADYTNTFRALRQVVVPALWQCFCFCVGSSQGQRVEHGHVQCF